MASSYHSKLYRDAKKFNERMKNGEKFMGFEYNPNFPSCLSDFLRARADKMGIGDAAK